MEEKKATNSTKFAWPKTYWSEPDHPWARWETTLAVSRQSFPCDLDHSAC